MSPADIALAAEMAAYFFRPYDFVLDAYPWGVAGTELEGEEGPDENQKEFLLSLGEEVKKRNFDGHTPVMPVRMAISKGHGTGGSTLGAWLVNWIMSTRPDSIGTVTAGTAAQLEARTWTAIQKWTKLCVTAHWWEVLSAGIYAKPHILTKQQTPENWKVVAQTCKEENSQSFAGQHSKNSTSWYLFDESSRVPDGIFKVAYGGLALGESMIFCFGQCERSSGEFYEICFGNQSDRWNFRRTDSRTSRFANQELLAEWERDYSAESDWFRVRVLGFAPNKSELQFIDSARVEEAQHRKVFPLADDPLVLGVDVSGGGAAWSVIRFRRGTDARSIPPIRIPGDLGREREVLISKLAMLLSDTSRERRVAMAFVDSAYGSPVVERLHVLGFSNVIEVAFGGKSPDIHCKNMRAYMYKELKDWLLRGAIDPEDKRLAADLVMPGGSINLQSKLVIEAKSEIAKRLGRSPDDSDALCVVAGTMIRTPNGEAPIEDLKVGDVVTTPFGDSEVAVTHVSEATALTTAEFSNGAELVGKGSHELFTFSAGVQRLDALSLTDEVESFSRWRRLLWLVVSMSFTGVRSFGFKQAAHTFSPGTRTRRSDFFIAGCTLTITALFQKASRYITRMTTGATMILETWNSSPLVPISANTCTAGLPDQENVTRSSDIWTGRSVRRSLGIVPQKESRGIVSTEKSPGKEESRSRQSARGAETNSIPSSPRGVDQKLRSTVRQRVCRPFNFAPTSRPLATVLSAVKSLWRTVIGRRPVVPASVRTENVPPTLVYNLTLREHNAYYANGILVFNCLTFAQPVGPIQHRDDSDYRSSSQPRPSGPDSWMVS